MITEEDMMHARLAMAIDTDGNIGIGKVRENESYRHQINVANTNIKLIEWLVENFGGKIPEPQVRDNPKHKDLYLWYLTGSNAYKILKKIRPYLLLKGEQADCVIELYEKVSKWYYTGWKQRPKYKKELQEELYQRVKALNKKGKHTEDQEPPKLVERRIVETLERYI